MAMIEDPSILFATDFSVPAQRAYAYAVRLVEAFSARLVIVNVLETPPGLDPVFPVNSLFLKQMEHETKLELGRLILAAENAGLRPVCRQVHGSPADAISHVAEETGAGLIVMGTHGRTGWDRVLLGSTAEKVLREAPCPVLTVRAADSDEASNIPLRIHVQRLLVPIDFSEYAQEAFEFAATLAQKLGAGVCLVHALEASAYPLDFSLMHVSDEKALHERVRARLQELVSVLKADGIAAECTTTVGVPAEVILAQAKGNLGGSADVIVMGTHGRRGLSRLALGSVAACIVKHAGCPVLTVKSPKYTRRIEKEMEDAK